jgi:hypothetical protein
MPSDRERHRARQANGRVDRNCGGACGRPRQRRDSPMQAKRSMTRFFTGIFTLPPRHGDHLEQAVTDLGGLAPEWLRGPEGLAKRR